MKISKEILVKIGIIIAILIIIIYNFFISNNNEEEINYSNMIIVNSLEENKEIPNKLETIKVYVTGEVNTPGVIELEEGARIEDAINLAGGITKEANLNEVNLAYKLDDEQKLYIPNVNDKEIEYLTEENGEQITEINIKDEIKKININKAGLEELETLKGVGEALAQRILSYREENGKFKTIDELKNVSGIGEKKFESIKDDIEV